MPLSIRRLILLALCATPITCFKTAPDAPHLYAFSPLAPSFDTPEKRAALTNLDNLGATIVDRGVNFSVYSENATRIDLLVFEDPEANLPTKEFPLQRLGNVWTGYVEGLGVGAYYGYVAWGPNWPYTRDPTWSPDTIWVPGTIFGFLADVDAKGNRFNPNKLLNDPYCKAFHRLHDWSKGSLASGPDRAQSDFAAASKCVIVESNYAWSSNETAWRAGRQKDDNPGHNWNDLIIYETHVKGFTMDKASGVEHPGTFRGLAEKSGYLKDLGINAVELLPVHQKPADGGYWGYMTLNFFAPELTYAATKQPRDVIDEFKGMVDQLHQQGIEVILDVVYNHYGEGGLWRQKIALNDVNFGGISASQLANLDPEEVASLYSFRGLDNAAYYALSVDKVGYWNNTGVGQESRANHEPVRRLIMDSLHFYAQEMHVDGFRFDLAPVLGERDGDYNNWDAVANTVLQQVIDDPVLQKNHVRIIAEPWEAGGNDPYKIGQFPAATKAPGVGWYEWNGRFRDWWRAFENNDAWVLNSADGDGQGRKIDGGGTLTGTAALYKWNRRPYHAVNFMTIHDGFTMYDLFSYDKKVNACGPLNPVCCDTPNSAWCDPMSGDDNSRSRNWGSDDAGEALKRQHMRNVFTAMAVAQGTPLLLGGDEWMRTQLGNNNAYSTGADNNFNWYTWGDWLPKTEKQRMHDFVRQLMKFRRTHSYAFAPTDYGLSAPFSWKSENNDANVNWSGKHLMMHYYDATKGPELAILINGERTGVNFTLPTGRSWHRIIDTQNYYDTPGYLKENNKDFTQSWNIDSQGATVITGGQYGVSASSIVVLEAR
jgi:isoamylase